MFGSKLMPLIVMSGIAMHGRQTLEAKAMKIFHTVGTSVNKQRMTTIIYRMQLDVASDDAASVQFADHQDLLKYIRTNVRLKDRRLDPGIDYWGTPFGFEQDSRNFTLISAGPDRHMGSEDDTRITQDLYDY